MTIGLITNFPSVSCLTGGSPTSLLLRMRSSMWQSRGSGAVGRSRCSISCVLALETAQSVSGTGAYSAGDLKFPIVIIFSRTTHNSYSKQLTILRQNSQVSFLMEESQTEQPLRQAVRVLKEAEYVIYNCGAGMGVDSGLPDFRGDSGFWNNYPPYKGKFNFYDCANPNFLKTNPELFWGFYGHRLQMYRQKQPHAGHSYLLNIAKTKKDFFTFTTNVDGHFTKVFGADKVYEVHGSIHYLQCPKCEFDIVPNEFKPQVDFDTMSCKILPTCNECGAIQRPNILMFYDDGFEATRIDQQKRLYDKFIKTIVKESPNSRIALVEIGAGQAIPTIRAMNQTLLRNFDNCTLIRINLEPNDETTKRLIYLKGGALDMLTRMHAEYFQN